MNSLPVSPPGDPLAIVGEWFDEAIRLAEAAFQQMVVRTIERRLGGSTETAEAKAWFGHEDLVIDYVNTFARVGVAER